MADFAPPPGPPPPKVPEGWKAQWNTQYNEWFYVNLHTKQSQWEKPTEPVYPSSDHDDAPHGHPPTYGGGNGTSPQPEKGGYLSSNNPYSGGGSNASGSNQNLSEDERLARQMQAEENARIQQSGGSRPDNLHDRGAADTYYQRQQEAAAANSASGYPNQQGYQSGQPSYDQQQLPPRAEKKGGLGGLLGKLSGKASGNHYGGHQAPYGGGGYGGPPQPYGGYQQGYGGYPPYQQAPMRQRHGLGAGGGAALGLGGGLLGGALLADAFDHDGGDGGGDYGGGGDDGGGGGDFGGGDGGGGGDF